MVSNDAPIRSDSPLQEPGVATASGGALALAPEPATAPPPAPRAPQPPVRARMPLGFALALVVLVALGAVTQASIADLVAAATSVTRSVQALERLHALKAVVRELEASELAILLTGRPQYKESYDTSEAEMTRLHRDLQDLLDSPRQRDQLQQLTGMTGEVSTFFRNALAPHPDGSRGDAPSAAARWRDGLVNDRLIDAVTAIEHEERQTLGERQSRLASGAAKAQ